MTDYKVVVDKSTVPVGCIGAIDDNEMRNVVGAVAQTLKDMGIKQVAPAPERRAA